MDILKLNKPEFLPSLAEDSFLLFFKSTIDNEKIFLS